MSEPEKARLDLERSIFGRKGCISDNKKIAASIPAVTLSLNKYYEAPKLNNNQ